MKKSSCKHPVFAVVLPAAGIGARVGADIPKQYLVLNGKTIIEHTIDALLSHPRINRIIVVLSKIDRHFDAIKTQYGKQVETVIGGNERVDSVLAGLIHFERTYKNRQDTNTTFNASLNSQSDWILVHDAARPCISHAEIDALLNVIKESNSETKTKDASCYKVDGAILAMPASDTLKQAKVSHHKPNVGDTIEEYEVIDNTLDRSTIWQAQTPQFFPVKNLIDAIMSASTDYKITDEASAIEHAGGNVRLVEGLSSNIKVTRSSDLALAEFFLRRNATEMQR